MDSDYTKYESYESAYEDEEYDEYEEPTLDVVVGVITGVYIITQVTRPENAARVRAMMSAIEREIEAHGNTSVRESNRDDTPADDVESRRGDPSSDS